MGINNVIHNKKNHSDWQAGKDVEEAQFVKNSWIRPKRDSLQTRREKARLVMFYRGTHGLVDIPPLKDLLPMPCKNTRNFHPKKYQPLTGNTNFYRGTFFPSTVNLWNALSPATLDQPNIAKLKDELDRLKKGESERVGRKALFSPFLLMPSSSQFWTPARQAIL